jgi:anthranilate synthase component 2
MANVLFIDNFDSFTYNLVDEFKSLDHQVTVVRNTIATDVLVELSQQHDLVVISPGPGDPQQAGNCLSFLTQVKGRVPVLGICLGHQLLIEQAGGRIGLAPLPVHGKTAALQHKQSHCFADLPNPLTVGRYHSLVALSVPDDFEVLATVDDLVMAIYQPKQRLLGFQFHPESILTTQGNQLLEQSIQLLMND